MASKPITQPESRDLPSTLDNLTGAPHSHPSQAVSTLPTLLVTSPGGYVHEILPPVRRTAVRLSPAAIRRLQAARHAESPPATASSLLNEQEDFLAEVQNLSFLSQTWNSLKRSFTSKSKRRRAKINKQAPGAATFRAPVIATGEARPGYVGATTNSPVWSIEAMDEFAQTRAPDDLFDDDFTPLSGSTPQPAPQTSHRVRGDYQRGRGERGGRGRGRGRAEAQGEVTREGQEPSESMEAVREGGREPAVRGDRSGTGGVKKPKLSEDELSARMEAVKLNNAKREAAHARAEADEASFQQREQVAQSKRLEERQNRRVMDGERERNRLRKLKAVGGREWDAEKNEEDFAERGGQSSQYRRGAHGGVAFDGGFGRRQDDEAGRTFANTDFDNREDGYVPRGPRGRGGRGRGRGRGRGGFNGQPSRDDNLTSHPPPGEADFPALPSGETGEKGGKDEKDGVGSSSRATPQATNSVQSPVGEKGSWADQVESTVPAPPGGW